MATGTSDDDVIIPIPEDAENDQWWLFKIMEGKDPPNGPKPRIQKVAQTLRQVESNKTCFDPFIVSFGPLHHGEPRLKPMEHYKEVAARWFLSLPGSNATINNKVEAKNVYYKFVAKASLLSSPKDFYADDHDHFVVDKYNEEEFMKMMFLDGCFILYFINLVVFGSVDNNLSKSTSHLNQQLVLRDMFLLENQIPYTILEALMSLKPERCSTHWITTFISRVFLPPFDFEYFELGPFRTMFLLSTLLLLFLLPWLFFCLISLILPAEREDNSSYDVDHLEEFEEGSEPHVHLLDFLRSKLISERVIMSPTSHGCGNYWDYCFCPVRELQATGIQVKSNKHRSFKNVEFKMGLINSHLELPPIIVDDSTKTRLLNLAAYEMCPDSSLSDRTVTSYICFLDSLIYNADDVRELRSKNILLNRLGSDDEVADLFKELAANLSPNYQVYSDVIEGIKLHRKRRLNHVRVWISQFISNHFTSPWTLVSLIAAMFVISLALVQTIYSILSYYKCK